MKKIILVALAVAMTSANLSAQDKQKTAITPEERSDKIVKKMKVRLSLTDAQQTALKPVILKRELQREAFYKSRKALLESNQESMKVIDCGNKIASGSCPAK